MRRRALACAKPQHGDVELRIKRSHGKHESRAVLRADARDGLHVPRRRAADPEIVRRRERGRRRDEEGHAGLDLSAHDGEDGALDPRSLRGRNLVPQLLGERAQRVPRLERLLARSARLLTRLAHLPVDSVESVEEKENGENDGNEASDRKHLSDVALSFLVDKRPSFARWDTLSELR